MRRTLPEVVAFEAGATARGTKAPRALTALNVALGEELAWVEPVDRRWQSDGREIQGWLYPAGGGRQPMVLEIHGGPHTLYGHAPMLEWQILAGSGISVLASNPRGSEGYGEAFNRANLGDWGDGPMADVLAGVDQAIADGLADPERLGVTGGSYGGYLTNWIVGKTDRFKAALACRSVVDMRLLFLTGDISGAEWARVEFGRSPWEDPEYFDSISPLSVAANIRTPLLIQHSERDLRTTVAQAEALFTVLRSLRRPVRFMRVPEESHELTRGGVPFRRAENLAQVRDWFVHFLVRGERRLPAPPKPQTAPRPDISRPRCSAGIAAERPSYPRRPVTRPTTSVARDTATRERAQELIRAFDSRAGSLGSLLGRVTPVDAVGINERVGSLSRRSIKKASKVWALDLAIRMMDLTTLEGKDTPGKIRALCAKGMRPQPGDASIPHVAAICVYPTFVAEAKEALGASGVKVASVSTAFPSGQSFLDIKLAETRAAVAAGADEIDMVIDRGAFLAGDYATVFEEIVAIKEAAGEAHLKVILETGELGTFDNVRRASVLAMAAGADFIKTSTGKIVPAATLPVTLVMLEAIRDFERVTGRAIGMKPAGGIRTAKESIQYLVVLYETLGPRWMTPDRFRFGASSLLNDVLMQLEKERTGVYQRPDHFTID